MTKLEGQAQQVPLADATPKKEVSSQVAEQMSLFEEGGRKYSDHRIENLISHNMTPMEVVMAVAELKEDIIKDPVMARIFILVVSNALIDFLDLFL